MRLRVDFGGREKVAARGVRTDGWKRAGAAGFGCIRVSVRAQPLQISSRGIHARATPLRGVIPAVGPSRTLFLHGGAWDR